ncbi:hypothetical protein BROUX41_001593 [Berkeleyomyces rouxiae]|uniref:uncharacterized protein n=1 Tax=Berkeleyomyces rouxiae TaxID=2035830 RepID=UPI003B790BB5
MWKHQPLPQTPMATAGPIPSPPATSTTPPPVLEPHSSTAMATPSSGPCAEPPREPAQPETASPSNAMPASVSHALAEEPLSPAAEDIDSRDDNPAGPTVAVAFASAENEPELSTVAHDASVAPAQHLEDSPKNVEASTGDIQSVDLVNTGTAAAITKEGPETPLHPILNVTTAESTTPVPLSSLEPPVRDTTVSVYSESTLSLPTKVPAVKVYLESQVEPALEPKIELPHHEMAASEADTASGETTTEISTPKAPDAILATEPPTSTPDIPDNNCQIAVPSDESLANGLSVDTETAITPIAPLPDKSSKCSCAHRPPMIGLPRMQTFKRQLSERRENLMAVLQTQAERRAISADRRLILSRAGSRGGLRSQMPRNNARTVMEIARSRSMVNPGQLNKSLPSMPNNQSLMVLDKALLQTGRVFKNDPAKNSSEHTTMNIQDQEKTNEGNAVPNNAEDHPIEDATKEHSDSTHVQNPETAMVPFDPSVLDDNQPLNQDELLNSAVKSENEGTHCNDEPYDIMSIPNDVISEELETRWILNLSMTYRDGSPREKFFVTFLQGTLWRRVTISLDYRNYERGSIESDLSKMSSQRQKSRRIYREIRSSLEDINFYETVTNLRLETCDAKLHIHVSEDANEVVNHPTTRQLKYLGCNFIKSRDIVFDSHASGFVYRVKVNGGLMILKEIPGRESVDEFLYEVNALHALRPSPGVINFFGLVYDDENPDYQDVNYRPVTGLLIEYAGKGALIDILHDSRARGVLIPPTTRLKWARQIIQGLADIHEAGFVQGDFTLTNIVIDAYDNARIIDINRRGCPVGWEPPEAIPIIQTKQRLNLHIGVKSDIFQLGMVLWALATQRDAPETYSRPLECNSENTEMPPWYCDLVSICLSPNPRYRFQASVLLSLFPHEYEMTMPVSRMHKASSRTYSYTDSDESETDDEDRGRSPMYFGRLSEPNPLVWTSPPSYAPSVVGDSEPAANLATTSAMRKGATSPMVNFSFKYQDFDVSGLGPGVAIQPAGMSQHQEHERESGQDYEDLREAVANIVPVDTDTEVEGDTDAEMEAGGYEDVAPGVRALSATHSVSSSVHSGGELVGAVLTAHASSNASAATSIATHEQHQRQGESEHRGSSQTKSAIDEATDTSRPMAVATQ